MHADIAVNASDGQFPGGTTGASEVPGARLEARGVSASSRAVWQVQERGKKKSMKQRREKREETGRGGLPLAATMLVLERARREEHPDESETRKATRQPHSR